MNMGPGVSSIVTGARLALFLLLDLNDLFVLRVRNFINIPFSLMWFWCNFHNKCSVMCVCENVSSGLSHAFSQLRPPVWLYNYVKFSIGLYPFMCQWIEMHEIDISNFAPNWADWYHGWSYFLGKLVYVWVNLQNSKQHIYTKTKLEYLPKLWHATISILPPPTNFPTHHTIKPV